MSDRCYVHGYVLQKDWPRFLEIVDRDDEIWESYEDLPGARAFSAYHAEGGWYNEAELAAHEGLTFLIYNEAGSEYGCGLGVSVGDGHHYTTSTNYERSITVSLHNDRPEVDPEDMKRATKAWLALQQVLHIFDLVSHNTPAEPVQETT